MIKSNDFCVLYHRDWDMLKNILTSTDKLISKLFLHIAWQINIWQLYTIY